MHVFIYIVSEQHLPSFEITNFETKMSQRKDKFTRIEFFASKGVAPLNVCMCMNECMHVVCVDECMYVAYIHVYALMCVYECINV